MIKTLAEKLAVLHMNLVKTWTDLMKDIVRYADEQQKKHKAVCMTLSVQYWNLCMDSEDTDQTAPLGVV